MFFNQRIASFSHGRFPASQLVLATAICLAMLVLSCWAAIAHAQGVTALDIVSPNPYSVYPGNPHNHGWAFTPKESLFVTHLGWFDGKGRGQTGEIGYIGDGLASSHPVAIWTTDATMLVSTTVRTSDPLEDQFRYREIPPTLLKSNATYVLSGLSLSGSSVRDAMAGSSQAKALDFNVDPAITFEGGRGPLWPVVNYLAFPGDKDWQLLFGPNFKFQVVPEPSTLTLASLGLLGLLAWGRRRRKEVSKWPTYPVPIAVR